MGTVVVGVDGSAQSMRALNWAVEEARFRGADVKAVYAYEYTPSWSAYAYAEAGAPSDVSHMQQQAARMMRETERGAVAAKRRAERLLERVVSQVPDAAGVTIESVAVNDRRPARALVQASRDADMLVVGSRGRGGFAELVLGSVSQQVAHHAICPLVIIRPRR